MTGFTPPMPNRLREPFLQNQALRPPKRLQRHIVEDYRDEIISLIRIDGARLADVVFAVGAQGEVVFEAGFRAEILAQIGTIKNIRAGSVKPASSKPAASNLASPVAASPAEGIVDDDDESFRVNRSRG